jgi:phosphotransferase system  glucose/maltose/N-acetylglucosamine-specific IIC component
MKGLLITVFVFVTIVVSAQTVPVQQPIEERYHISYWWWILGVLIALGIGVGIYLLIKKDPRKDAVR